jgi:hypothetical protein
MKSPDPRNLPAAPAPVSPRHPRAARVRATACSLFLLLGANASLPAAEAGSGELLYNGIRLVRSGRREISIPPLAPCDNRHRAVYVAAKLPPLPVSKSLP